MTEHVITLLANPKMQKLAPELVQQIAQTLGCAQVKWRQEGAACDLTIMASGVEMTAVRERLASLLQHSPSVDFILQPLPRRPKRLLISDMDSTMVTVECLDELADFAGKKAQVAEITERAMRGELNFEQALCERVAMIAGLPEAALDECYRERVRMMPGAKELVAAMKKTGAHCALVSGGFTFFTKRVAQELGFDEHFGNTLEIQDGKLTGRVIPPILGKEAKLEILQRLCSQRGIALEDTLAIGDGANDVPMLLAAGLGVAYHAKPNVRAQVAAQLNHCDLSALIHVLDLNSVDRS